MINIIFILLVVYFSFSPTDHKLATCSDDGTVRIWDFLRCHEERILRGKYYLHIFQDKLFLTNECV